MPLFFKQIRLHSIFFDFFLYCPDIDRKIKTKINKMVIPSIGPIITKDFFSRTLTASRLSSKISIISNIYYRSYRSMVSKKNAFVSAHRSTQSLLQYKDQFITLWLVFLTLWEHEVNTLYCTKYFHKLAFSTHKLLLRSLFYKVFSRGKIKVWFIWLLFLQAFFHFLLHRDLTRINV